MYRPLLRTLANNGYKEYQLKDDPALTVDKCDVSQIPAQPNLFVFPYDWRYGNAISAQNLKKYIDCVRQFYPDRKVNIIAHSQGGLVARRYILDHLTDHNVDKLITINTPFWGAPKAIFVMESGDFIPIVQDQTIRFLAPFFTSVHELLPSQKYFDLVTKYGEVGGSPGQTPFVELGWDINGNGDAYEYYDYNTFVNLFDSRYPRRDQQTYKPEDYPSNALPPGTANQTFHNKPGQDNFAGDTSGVEYHHIVSTQYRNNTIGRVYAEQYTECKNTTDPNTSNIKIYCVSPNYGFRTEVVAGDGTVPISSQDRGWIASNKQVINLAPNNHIWYEFSLNESQDAPWLQLSASHEHSGIIQNTHVQAKILNILGLGPDPGYTNLEASYVDKNLFNPFYSPFTHPRESAASSINKGRIEPQVAFEKTSSRDNAPSRDSRRRTGIRAYMPQSMSQHFGSSAIPTSFGESYYVTIKGVNYVSVTDIYRNTNYQIDDISYVRVPDVSYFRLGDKSTLISMPTDSEYQLMFTTGDSPVGVEIVKGTTNTKPTMATRYHDISLPPNTNVMLLVTPNGAKDLYYDADGDGIFETLIPPTISLTDAAASDVTPPKVSINSSFQNNQTTISIFASDAESGVKNIYYSVDGANYQLYNAPFVLNLSQSRTVWAFADDNAANRSSVVTYTITNRPPDVSKAQPSVATLWPPNHKMVSVSIQGVTDPDGDAVTIRIDRIAQDEPTNDTGDGNTCPDATGIGTATAQLRVERSGNGNGRVYTIFFTATDSRGASSQGSVKVSVPKDRNSTAADDGVMFDSTKCQ